MGGGRRLSAREFFSTLKQKWLGDSISNVAGAVTFSAVLALFPFLVFLVALASLFIDPRSEAAIIESLSHVAPEAVTSIVAGRIRALSHQHSVGILTGSFVAALWSVSGGVMSLMTALNTCYGVRETRSFWRTRGIAIGMTLLGAALSIVAGAAALAVPAIARSLGGWAAVLVSWLRLPLAALVMMFLWAMLYSVLPNVKQRFRLITPGSVVGVLLWLVASYGFSEYVGHFGKYEVTYGALAGFAILLLWMWLSAQVMLLGAEINAILDGAGKQPGTGSEPAPPPGARPVKASVVHVPTAPPAGADSHPS